MTVMTHHAQLELSVVKINVGNEQQNCYLLINTFNILVYAMPDTGS